jgi:hypothetical protein
MSAVVENRDCVNPQHSKTWSVFGSTIIIIIIIINIYYEAGHS